MWLQQEEFKNPDLLCIELPKMLEKMPEGLRKLVQGGDDCLPEWKRDRPIAYGMGSDCYRLYGSDQDPSNYIGFRHTWIKMSRPSIEALRQAFLDRDSGIRFGSQSPEEAYTYPKIRRISVQGASFLKADPITWSPNLNCLIGSRGTGKSTLLDYLRLTLDRLRDGDLPDDLRDEINDRIRDTLLPTAQVEVVLEKPEGEYRVVYRDGQRQVFAADAKMPDLGLDVRTFSLSYSLATGD